MQVPSAVAAGRGRRATPANPWVPAAATHHLSLYKDVSGSLVVGAGTGQWGWGLDTHHDTNADGGSSTPDANMRQATINLLADMRVQPATIQGALTATQASTDQTRPSST